MKLTDVLDKPEHWTQRCLARDAEGNFCPVNDPAAQSFCLTGAAWRLSLANGVWFDPIFDAIRAGVVALSGANEFPPSYNDAPLRTFAEIRAVCEYADNLLAEKGT